LHTRRNRYSGICSITAGFQDAQSCFGRWWLRAGYLHVEQP
jgi:hypothetical protein